ncbi:MAG TPA: ectoine/hydroxyectoine ABC transporter permease subunit EhuC [Pseudonocardiaceae bacterium]|nr:ectoine/hydroxyectoine ABC transporter permease subunit EhuC [Pseudonocardiaceae bacterium]
MFANLGHFLSVLSAGLPPTVELTVGGIVVATVMSFVAGLANTSRFVVVRFMVRVYVEGWRGTSELVQLFWIYFAVPLLLGFQIVPLWAGVLVLGLNHGAYGAEIVRGAVRSVAQEQYEGAVALNFTPTQRMIRVILPQAVVEMLPSFGTLFIQLLKATAIVSLITVPELTYQAKQILIPVFSAQTPLILFAVLVFYLILAIVITVLMRLAERLAGARIGRRPVRRPWRNVADVAVVLDDPAGWGR